MTTSDLRGVRRDYQSTGIRRSEMAANPVEQFNHWLQDAVDAGAIDATSMTLATSGADGRPTARVVLLKHVDDHGFCWYTDSRSQKGQQIAENPNASLLFYWREFNRQVRIVGQAHTLSAEDAETYFRSRPAGSRFSAASSLQSSEVESRDVLEKRVAELQAQYPDGDVPRPDAWIGYRLIPEEFEFWQGKVDRLHDRIIYQRNSDNWTLIRRSP